MATLSQCDFCKNAIPLSVERCPHCAQPGLFPNVRLANDPEETTALEKRYQTAIAAAATSNTSNNVRSFEDALQNSKAVIAKSVNEVLRLITNTSQIFATYYQLIEAQVRLPEGSKWDSLRRVADSAIFKDQMQHIRFAALSLDNRGLSNYGGCSMVLRSDLIAHRASLFEENSVLFMKHHNVLMSEADKLPPGHKAVWQQRAKLCVAKLASKITTSTKPLSFPALLLKEGMTSEDDDFVEVHIWGPMTSRTIERVALASKMTKAERPIAKAIREKLNKIGVAVN